MISSKIRCICRCRSKNTHFYYFDRNTDFDLEQLIHHICEKLKISKNNEVLLVLIKWIEVLQAIQNVNILQSVPKFLEKLLSNIDIKNISNTKATDQIQN